MSTVVFIFFVFALGACVGSFLNVVVWRLPRGESLASPPSHCPKCNTKLAWYDNIPVFGWLALRGKCRYCHEAISPRYPIVEALCGLLFALYYAMFFIWQIGPCPPQPPGVVSEFDGSFIALLRPLTIQEDWPIFSLYLFLLACLLAASLIDAELFIIPIEIPWLAAIVGIGVHALVDRPSMPGAVNVGALGSAVGAGGAIGLFVSLVLYRAGIIKPSFPKGEPLLEVDRDQIAREIEEARQAGRKPEFEGELPPAYTRGQIRREIGMEMLFLLPPLIGAGLLVVLTHTIPALASCWKSIIAYDWVSGLLGSILGALVGGFVVWITRILGTLGFGRVAMGLGDVHLMLGVGAVIGAGATTVAFFLAPFFGILVAGYMLIARTRRELPYGPYLSLATAFVMLFYCPIAAYLTPGMQGLMIILERMVGGGQ